MIHLGKHLILHLGKHLIRGEVLQFKSSADLNCSNHGPFIFCMRLRKVVEAYDQPFFLVQFIVCSLLIKLITFSGFFTGSLILSQ